MDTLLVVEVSCVYRLGMDIRASIYRKLMTSVSRVWYLTSQELKRRNMDPECQRILRKNVILFRQDMVKVQEVAEHLWSEEIISVPMKDDIMSKATEGDRAGALHMLMLQRGPKAFDAYYKALRHSENHHLADILEPYIAKNRIQRESATFEGATGHQSTVINQLVKTDDDGPDLPETWFVYRDAKPLDVTVRKCDLDDSVMKKRFNNEKEVYSMKGRTTGVRVLIINNNTFPENPQDTGQTLHERVGRDIDAEALNHLFTELGYKYVKITQDLTGEGIMETLRHEAGQCKITDNAFICVILSWGKAGAVYGVDGALVEYTELYEQFDGRNYPNLVGKPKIFFIQAAQGYKLLRVDEDEEDYNFSTPLSGPSISPTNPDVLVSTATTEGYMAWRRNERGSWYIQALVYVIKNYAYKCDLHSILAKTNTYVGKQETTMRHKQCTAKSDTFRKAFYFFPGFE